MKTESAWGSLYWVLVSFDNVVLSHESRQDKIRGGVIVAFYSPAKGT